MRPIDQKLKYQIDKLVRTAVTGSLGKISNLLKKSSVSFRYESGFKEWLLLNTILRFFMQTNRRWQIKGKTSDSYIVGLGAIVIWEGNLQLD